MLNKNLNFLAILLGDWIIILLFSVIIILYYVTLLSNSTPNLSQQERRGVLGVCSVVGVLSVCEWWIEGVWKVSEFIRRVSCWCLESMKRESKVWSKKKLN